MTRGISRRDTAIFVGAVLVMLAGMIASIYYPYPSGQSMDVAGFIKLWLRELILLGGIAIAIVIGGFAWLVRRFKQRHKQAQNEPLTNPSSGTLR